MTKLEKLKKRIGYTKENLQCQNCKHFKSDITIVERWGNKYTDESNIRCEKYNFATKKTTTCNEHEKKEELND